MYRQVGSDDACDVFVRVRVGSCLLNGPTPSKHSEDSNVGQQLHEPQRTNKWKYVKSLRRFEPRAYTYVGLRVGVEANVFIVAPKMS